MAVPVCGSYIPRHKVSPSKNRTLLFTIFATESPVDLSVQKQLSTVFSVIKAPPKNNSNLIWCLITRKIYHIYDCPL